MKDTIGLAVNFDYAEENLKPVFDAAEKAMAKKMVVARLLAEDERYLVRDDTEGISTCEHVKQKVRGSTKPMDYIDMLKEESWLGLFLDPRGAVFQVVAVCDQCIETVKDFDKGIMRFGSKFGYKLVVSPKNNWTIGQEIVIPMMVGLKGRLDPAASFETMFKGVAEMAVHITTKDRQEGAPKIFLFYEGNVAEMLVMPRYNEGSPMDLVKPIIFDRNPQLGFAFLSFAWTADMREMARLRPDMACPTCKGKGDKCSTCNGTGCDKTKWRRGIIEEVKEARREVMVLTGMDKTTSKYHAEFYRVKRQVPNDDTTEIVGIEPYEQFEAGKTTYPKFPIVKDGQWHDPDGVYIARVVKKE